METSTVAHAIEQKARELILEIDQTDIQSAKLINKVRDLKQFFTSLDKGRELKGIPNPFKKIKEEDEQL